MDLSLPFSPLNSLVVIDHWRSQPSSWLLDVRSFSGQYGQVSALFSCTGGLGITSSCKTDFAPWRVLVPATVGTGVAAADHDDLLAETLI